MLVVAPKVSNGWQAALVVVLTAGIASGVTALVMGDSSPYIPDNVITALERGCTDGADSQAGTNGQDGQDGTDVQDGTDGQDGTCTIVIGPQGPVGATGPTGPTGPQGEPGNFTGYHGSFYDSSTQPIVNVNTAQAMRLNNSTPGVNGVTADQVSVVNDTRITFAHPGVYNLQFSAQLSKTANQLDNVDIWLAYNGTAMPWTNTEFTVPADAKRYVAAWNFMFTVSESNDWVELMWSSPEPTMRILSVPEQTNPIRPGIPSLIATVHQVQ